MISSAEMPDSTTACNTDSLVNVPTNALGRRQSVRQKSCRMAVCTCDVEKPYTCTQSVEA